MNGDPIIREFNSFGQGAVRIGNCDYGLQECFNNAGQYLWIMITYQPDLHKGQVIGIASHAEDAMKIITTHAHKLQAQTVE